MSDFKPLYSTPLYGVGARAASQYKPDSLDTTSDESILGELKSAGGTALTGLERLGTWLSRPGYAVRDLLVGNPLGALKNVGDFAIGLPTLGLVKPFELSSQEDMPMTTDVMKSWGMDTPENGIGKFALNFVGDTLTDPITYLTLGTGAAIRGLKGATGAADIAKAASAGATAAGRAEIAARAAEIMPQVAERFGQTAGRLKLAPEVTNDLVQRLATQRAAKEFGQKILTSEPQAVSELFRVPGVRFGVPFTEGTMVHASSDIPYANVDMKNITTPWSSFSRYTAPGLVMQGLEKFAPQTAEKVAQVGSDVGNWFKTTFDKYAGDVPDKVKELARNRDNFTQGRIYNSFENISKLTKDIPEAVQTRVGEHYLAMQDALAELPNPSDDVVKNLWDGMLTSVKTEFPTLADKLEPALKSMQGDMVAAAKESMSLGLLKSSGIDPRVYLPFQYNNDVAKLISEATGNENVGARLRNVFEEFRNNRNTTQFKASIQKMLNDLGIAETPAELQNTNISQLWMKRMASQAKSAEQQKFMREAWTRFGEDAQKTELRTKLGNLDTAIANKQGEIEAAKAAALPSMPADVTKLEEELKGLQSARQFSLPQAKTMEFNSPQVSEYVKKLSTGLGAKSGIERALSAVNKVFKPALTVGYASIPNISFHVRNAVSGIWMAALEPDLGAKGLNAIWNMVGELPLVRNFNLSPTEAGVINRALRAGEQAPTKAAQLLNAADKITLKTDTGMTYTGRQLIELVKKNDVAGGYVSHELLGGQGLYGDKRGLWNAIKSNKVSADMARSVESNMRVNAFVELVRKGIDPTEAANRVKKIFVDYNLQSKWDRIIREVSLFSRFTTGIVPPMIASSWARPRILSTIAHMPLISQDKNLMLPQYIQEQTPIATGLTDADGNPVVVSSLGTIHESLNPLINLGSGGGTRRAAEKMLGTLSPLLKAPLEYATGKSFYFDKPISGYNRAPSYMQALGIGRPEVSATGKVTRTIPGWINSAIDSLPLSRQEALFDTILDTRKTTSQKMVNLLTGVRMAGVNQRQELLSRIKEHLDTAVAAGDLKPIEIYKTLVDNDPKLKALLSVRQELMSRPKASKSGVTGVPLYGGGRG